MRLTRFQHAVACHQLRTVRLHQDVLFQAAYYVLTCMLSLFVFVFIIVRLHQDFVSTRSRRAASQRSEVGECLM